MLLRRVVFVVLVWGASGFGAVAGSAAAVAIAGKMNSVLFTGATAGGALFAVLSAWIGARVVLNMPAQASGAAAGAAAGFAIAAAVAVNNLRTPVIPVLCAAITGILALAGAHFARRKPSSPEGHKSGS